MPALLVPQFLLSFSRIEIKALVLQKVSILPNQVIAVLALISDSCCLATFVNGGPKGEAPSWMFLTMLFAKNEQLWNLKHTSVLFPPFAHFPSQTQVKSSHCRLSWGRAAAATLAGWAGPYWSSSVYLERYLLTLYAMWHQPVWSSYWQWSCLSPVEQTTAPAPAKLPCAFTPDPVHSLEVITVC